MLLDVNDPALTQRTVFEPTARIRFATSTRPTPVVRKRWPRGLRRAMVGVCIVAPIVGYAIGDLAIADEPRVVELQRVEPETPSDIPTASADFPSTASGTPTGGEVLAPPAPSPTPEPQSATASPAIEETTTTVTDPPAPEPTVPPEEAAQAVPTTAATTTTTGPPPTVPPPPTSNPPPPYPPNPEG